MKKIPSIENLQEFYVSNNKSSSTSKTYSSHIRALLRNVGDFNNSIEDLLSNPKILFNYLDTLTINTSKSYLTSIVVLTSIINHPSKSIFSTKLDEIVNESKKIQMEQKKSDKEAKNWLDWNQILKIVKEKEKVAKALIKNNPSEKEILSTIQDWVIASIYTKIPPRRIGDYTNLQFLSDSTDKTKSNYIDMKTMKLHFNIYKTVTTYGEEIIEIPKSLLKVFKIWRKYNTDDYVFIKHNKKSFSQPDLSKRLNSIFGEGISVNMLRHSFLTEVYKKCPALKDMAKLSREMSHSIATQMLYVRKD